MKIRRPFARAAAFSRRDLLATVALAALLVVVTQFWRAKSRDLPRRKACERNLHQLGLGFNSYEADMGHYPGAARVGVATNDDWIYWQTERLLNDSPIAAHATNLLSSLRCPGDAKFSYRGYPYSYSMNVRFERASTRRIPNVSQLILLYEEESPNDGACLVGSSTDPLTTRHAGRSSAGFLDGHVEIITESEGASSSRAGR